MLAFTPAQSPECWMFRIAEGRKMIPTRDGTPRARTNNFGGALQDGADRHQPGQKQRTFVARLPSSARRQMEAIPPRSSETPARATQMNRGQHEARQPNRGWPTFPLHQKTIADSAARTSNSRPPACEHQARKEGMKQQTGSSRNDTT